MNSIVIDTGFWRAIYNVHDAYYVQGQGLLQRYLDSGIYKILIPFPSMYELLRTEFVKNKLDLNDLDNMVHRRNVEFVYDESYRDIAFREMLSAGKRNLSLVDCLIRAMLDDESLCISGLITFNIGDFYDVCRRNGIEICF